MREAFLNHDCPDMIDSQDALFCTKPFHLLSTILVVGSAEERPMLRRWRGEYGGAIGRDAPNTTGAANEATAENM